MNSTQFDLIQELWDRLEITEVLKKHFPENRWHELNELLELLGMPKV